MKGKELPVVVLVALSLMLISTVGSAQSAGGKSAPAVGGSLPRMEPQMPISECYYCVGPDKPTLWKWQVDNKFRDLDVATRSKLNPESDLDYMIRTY